MRLQRQLGFCTGGIGSLACHYHSKDAEMWQRDGAQRRSRVHITRGSVTAGYTGD